MTEQQGFRTVLRGYDPGEVDRRLEDWSQALERARAEAAHRTSEVGQLQTSHERLGDEVRAHKARIAELEDEAKKAVSPSFAGLGERIGFMLTLADEEAATLRQSADEDAQRLRDTAKSEAEETRIEADRYAAETRATADADAARVLEKARQLADALLDDAGRESAARRKEGEALFESQRAKASAAAADFESTLGERREKAAAELAALMAEQQRLLDETQARSTALGTAAEAERVRAREESESILARAQAEAEELLASARAQADRVRRDSDRELAATAAQRDAITAQLGNVRTMLATVGGGSVLGGSLMAAAMDDPDSQVQSDDVVAGAEGHAAPQGPDETSTEADGIGSVSERDSED